MKRQRKEVYTFAEDGEQLNPKPMNEEELCIWNSCITHINKQMFNDNNPMHHLRVLFNK